MIEVAGEWWGTAAEIAEHIGQGVTVKAVRHWGDRGELPLVRTTGEDGRPEVRYLLGVAIRIEAAKRLGQHSRRRVAA